MNYFQLKQKIFVVLYFRSEKVLFNFIELLMYRLIQ